MADTPYTVQEYAKWRGPTTSDKYNERIENLYKDLVMLYNKSGITAENVGLHAQRFAKDHFALMQAVFDLEARIQTLEESQNRLTFWTDSQIDTDRFIGTAYEINDVDHLFQDSQHGLLTLPKVVSNLSSKIYFTNSNNDYVLPPSFEVIVAGIAPSADSTGAFIDQTDVHNAFLPQSSLIWQRNIITNSAVAGGAELYVYVRLPVELLININSNAIVIQPFPIVGCELEEIAYSTSQNVLLNDKDDYQPLNNTDLYDGDTDAIGFVPPGGWTGDSIKNCGPKTFYFDPRQITAIRLKLKQQNYFVEGGKYVYSYGMSRFDIRYDKFLETGKALIRFDAPGSNTISSVDDVQPQIYNVSEGEVPSIFSYRIIWETAYNSGTYTLTPVPLSKRVWLEVTLDKTLGKGSPALSGIVLEYS